MPRRKVTYAPLPRLCYDGKRITPNQPDFRKHVRVERTVDGKFSVRVDTLIPQGYVLLLYKGDRIECDQLERIAQLSNDNSYFMDANSEEKDGQLRLRFHVDGRGAQLRGDGPEEMRYAHFNYHTDMHHASKFVQTAANEQGANVNFCCVPMVGGDFCVALASLRDIAKDEEVLVWHGAEEEEEEEEDEATPALESPSAAPTVEAKVVAVAAEAKVEEEEVVALQPHRGKKRRIDDDDVVAAAAAAAQQQDRDLYWQGELLKQGDNLRRRHEERHHMEMQKQRQNFDARVAHMQELIKVQAAKHDAEKKQRAASFLLPSAQEALLSVKNGKLITECERLTQQHKTATIALGTQNALTVQAQQAAHEAQAAARASCEARVALLTENTQLKAYMEGLKPEVAQMLAGHKDATLLAAQWQAYGASEAAARQEAEKREAALRVEHTALCVRLAQLSSSLSRSEEQALLLQNHRRY